jgi:hypothetical protein
VCSGLTRIRPKKCSFKDAFFGSNSLELGSGGIKIGDHTQDFTRREETQQPETARASRVALASLVQDDDLNGLLDFGNQKDEENYEAASLFLQFEYRKE